MDRPRAVHRGAIVRAPRHAPGEPRDSPPSESPGRRAESSRHSTVANREDRRSEQQDVAETARTSGTTRGPNAYAKRCGRREASGGRRKWEVKGGKSKTASAIIRRGRPVRASDVGQ